MSPKFERLLDVDGALLEQLEHGEEPHDDLELLDERRGELAERDAADPGQLVDQLGHGVDHRRPDRRDVEHVDPRRRLRCRGPQEGLARAARASRLRGRRA